jgi:cholesterol transport system auxiliary component
VGTFDRAAASDRLLTVEGDKTAFIANARWVASAQSLFEGALSNSFIASPGPARLLDRGELTAADYRLDVTVRRFETRYESGPHAPPVVEVVLSASLDSNRSSPSRRDQSFEARTEAKADSMSAIVAAYSESVGEVLAKLRAWVEAKGQP